MWGVWEDGYRTAMHGAVACLAGGATQLSGVLHMQELLRWLPGGRQPHRGALGAGLAKRPARAGRPGHLLWQRDAGRL